MNWPQAGDVGILGDVTYVQPVVLRGTPVWLLRVRCDPSLYPFVSADKQDDPLVFWGWSFSPLSLFQPVTFDLVAREFGANATNVTPADDLESLLVTTLKLCSHHNLREHAQNIAAGFHEYLSP